MTARSQRETIKSAGFNGRTPRYRAKPAEVSYDYDAAISQPEITEFRGLGKDKSEPGFPASGIPVSGRTLSARARPSIGGKEISPAKCERLKSKSETRNNRIESAGVNNEKLLAGNCEEEERFGGQKNVSNEANTKVSSTESKVSVKVIATVNFDSQHGLKSIDVPCSERGE